MDDELRANKSLGQHWLTNLPCLEAMCNAAEVGSGDTVLEIGPGLGSLTELLVARSKQVIAIEFDERLARELPSRVTAYNLQVLNQDILGFDFGDLPLGYKVVANIPYYLTSNLVRLLSETPNPPAVAALLVQKEVAERIAAEPGRMSMLSVTAQYFWEVSLGREVAAELFTPPPKVDSQIVVLRRRLTPLHDDIDAPVFFRLVKAGFSQRRKTLLNSLSAGLRVEKDVIRQMADSAGIDPGRRPQTLSLEEWYGLYKTHNT